MFLSFNDGVHREIDLKDVIARYEIVLPLKDPVEFSKFFLNPRPTLCWRCGFDIAPDTLREMLKS